MLWTTARALFFYSTIHKQRYKEVHFRKILYAPFFEEVHFRKILYAPFFVPGEENLDALKDVE